MYAIPNDAEDGKVGGSYPIPLGMRGRKTGGSRANESEGRIPKKVTRQKRRSTCRLVFYRYVYAHSIRCIAGFETGKQEIFVVKELTALAKAL